MMRTTGIAIGILAAALIAAVLLLGDRSGDPVAGGPREAPEDVDGPRAGTEPAGGGSERRAATAEPPDTPEAPGAEVRHRDDELIAALARIGAISLGKEDGDLSPELVPIITGVTLERWQHDLAVGSTAGLDTASSWRVLQLFEAGRLFERRFAPDGADPWRAPPSAAEIGGYQVVAFSLLSYGNPERPGINSLGPVVPVVNGREYTLAVLRMLPSIHRSGPFSIPGAAGPKDAQDFRTWFYRSLGSARGADGRFLLDGYFGAILALDGRLTGDELALLLANVKPSTPEEQRLHLQRILTREPLDPDLAAHAIEELAALAAAHPDVVGLEQTLVEFKDLFGRSDSVAVRSAIANAVAAHDDVAQAATFLAELESHEALAAYDALSARPGGGTALFDEYLDRMREGRDPEQRLALVMGMGDGDLGKVRQVLREDPDPAVRGQGFMTLSTSPGWEPTTDDVDSFFAQTDVPLDYRIPIASNFLSRGGEHAGMVGFLAGIAGDEARPRPVRERAAEKLDAYLSAAEIAALLAD